MSSSSLQSALSSLPQNTHALVVGGTAGIGLGVARQLSTLPSASVTIAGRNAQAASVICREAPHNNINFRAVDATSMKEVRRLCKEYSADLRAKQGGKAQVDVLVLTQGILSASLAKTPEGINRSLSLNYYSRMFFIRELDHLGILSPNAIIVSVLNSQASDPTGAGVFWHDLGFLHSKIPWWKLKAAATHPMSLTDILLQDMADDPNMSQKRTFIHAYPGFVDTDILAKSELPNYVKVLVGFFTAIVTFFRPNKHVSTAYSGERIVVGSINAAKGVNQGYHGIDDEGKELDKVQSSDESRRKVREHTWGLIDQALAS